METPTPIITVCSNPEHAQGLISSAQKNGWDIISITAPWAGFGTKLIETYNFLKTHPEIKQFVFCDAYDVVVLGTPEEALSKIDLSKITFSAEKNCWPDSSLSEKYPHPDSKWKFLNSGCYFAPSDLFLKLFEWDMPEYDMDDQLWATKQFLFNDDSEIVLDTGCKVFQSYSFIEDDDFSYNDGRLMNMETKMTGCFCHGNGRTNMDKIKELLLWQK